jgi:hypothetical protein
MRIDIGQKGCQAQGKGGVGIVVATSAIQRRLPSWQV